MIAKVMFAVDYGFNNDFLNFILRQGIDLYSIKQTEYGFTAICHARDYRKIAFLSRKFQCRVRIRKKKGIYFVLHPLKQRCGILLVVCLFPFLCAFFSCIIWKVTINTDDTRLKNAIGHSLYNQGVYRGSYCTKTKLDEAQQQLMLENKNLGYITLNFYRGILECNVYLRNEKTDSRPAHYEEDITCTISGIVTDIRVYSGFQMVKPGESVCRGDVLVAASRTDSRGSTDMQSTAAYIAGDCEKEYRVYIPYNKNAQVYTGLQKRNVTVSFMEKNYHIVQNDLSDFGNYIVTSTVVPASFFGFSFPFTVKTDVYSQLGEMGLVTDFPQARKNGHNQLSHIIAADEKMEQEYTRNYDYIVSEEGVTVVCCVRGRYIMI